MMGPPCKKWPGSASKISTLTIQGKNPTPRYICKRNENMSIQKLKHRLPEWLKQQSTCLTIMRPKKQKTKQATKTSYTHGHSSSTHNSLKKQCPYLING
jgi:hypothetical protein